MSNRSLTFDEKLTELASPAFQAALPDIRHGVEREALRILASGHLSQSNHPEALGSALTHDSITTDFSESLLEFITPPEKNVNKTLQQLSDIHKFVLANMGEEALWPMSMPCYVNGSSNIPIAQYGRSHVGRMKSTYRVGLRNRYGAMMQAIAGVHFNFSLPDSFWQHWADTNQQTYSQDFVSQQYFDMIRNYRRWCWLIPFLYGASPALCGSFLDGKKHNFSFRKLGKGTLYLPYATSLRMSDLGYTNSQQSALQICYNRLPDYIDSVRSAIRTHSTEYERFAAGEGGVYEQLNRNILQIENELYSPIRPKQPAKSLEKPTDALASRGVKYIEVRALDVNPFSDVGIAERQFYFLDVFLLTCLLTDSPDLDQLAYQETEKNLKRTVTEGRDPALKLLRRGAANNADVATEVSLTSWATDLFTQFTKVAKHLDSANKTTRYSDAVEFELAKVQDPNKTPSAILLNKLIENDMDNGAYGLALSHEYKELFSQRDYQVYSREHFTAASQQSLAQQHAIEDADSGSFDEFLATYFKQ